VPVRINPLLNVGVALIVNVFAEVAPMVVFAKDVEPTTVNPPLQLVAPVIVSLPPTVSLPETADVAQLLAPEQVWLPVIA